MKKEKLYLASTGKEVAVGDVIEGTLEQGGIISSILATVDYSTIPLLKAAGILVSDPIKPNTTIPSAITMPKVIERIASRLGWKPQKVESYINTLSTIMPMAAFSLMAREIAVMLDEKYPNHINESEKIYSISTLDGRIHEVCKAYVKNYRNFAAFRSIEDAKLACSILKNQLKMMFKSGK